MGTEVDWKREVNVQDSQEEAGSAEAPWLEGASSLPHTRKEEQSHSTLPPLEVSPEGETERKP